MTGKKRKRLTDEERLRAAVESPLGRILGVKPENVILGPTRAQLLADGALVDVTTIAGEAGFKVPVAVTRGVWERHVRVPEGDDSGQDQEGRLWDVVWMAGFGARSSVDESRIAFKLISSANEGRKLGPAVETKLVLVLHGGDAAEPVMTIMLPEED